MGMGMLLARGQRFCQTFYKNKTASVTKNALNINSFKVRKQAKTIAPKENLLTAKEAGKIEPINLKRVSELSQPFLSLLKRN
jgi:hypothetical protein